MVMMMKSSQISPFVSFYLFFFLLIFSFFRLSNVSFMSFFFWFIFCLVFPYNINIWKKSIKKKAKKKKKTIKKTHFFVNTYKNTSNSFLLTCLLFIFILVLFFQWTYKDEKYPIPWSLCLNFINHSEPYFFSLTYSTRLCVQYIYIGSSIVPFSSFCICIFLSSFSCIHICPLLFIFSCVFVWFFLTRTVLFINCSQNICWSFFSSCAKLYVYV